MDIHQLILHNRSYRRFDATLHVATDTLRGLVELARLSPSARNLQPLKYMLVNTPTQAAAVFRHIAWAGYLSNGAPCENERPTAYIVVAADRTLTQASIATDAGIAAQTILLGATAQGLGGCIIGAVQREPLAKSLKLPDYLEIELVLAIGRPTEHVQIEPLDTDGSIRYYRDAEAVHHVPKRALDDLIIPNSATEV